MGNYHYIIAGLPELALDFEKNNFSYSSTSQLLREQLGKREIRFIDWLEFGFDANNLSNHFYRGASSNKSKFISAYFEFDNKIRNIQAKFIADREDKKFSNYLVGSLDVEFDEYQKVLETLKLSNILDREQSMDIIRWNKISEIITFDYFNIEVILAFLAKVKIVDRWNKLDKEAGAAFFEQLVQEVSGTFKGVEIK